MFLNLLPPQPSSRSTPDNLSLYTNQPLELHCLEATVLSCVVVVCLPGAAGVVRILNCCNFLSFCYSKHNGVFLDLNDIFMGFLQGLLVYEYIIIFCKYAFHRHLSKESRVIISPVRDGHRVRPVSLYPEMLHSIFSHILIQRVPWAHAVQCWSTFIFIVL